MKARLLCGIAMLVCIAGGIGGAVAGNRFEAVCVATNASGQRVVIGTELNDSGLRYKRENPADSNDEVLESLGGKGPEAAWTPESIARCRSSLALAHAAPLVFLPVAGVFAVMAMRTRALATRRPKRGTVFLSYNHEDAAAARKLCRVLQEHSIPVLVDSDSMKPGERIQGFIDRSIREAEVVVSLVSSRSLLSAWVALETMQTLQRNRWVEGRRLIACYLDDGFFDPQCRLELTGHIDERLRQIEGLIPDYAARRLDTVDLNEEKTRLYDLRNNLGVILATLKDSLCLDLREDRFEESCRRLAAAIRQG